MNTSLIPSIDHILGSGEDRYFATGFKSFEMKIQSFEISEECLQGHLHIQYRGPDRPHGDPVHVGSIEYLALFLRLATHGLNRIGRIGIDDTDRAFLTDYQLQVKHPLFMGTHSYYCRIIETPKHSYGLQGCKTRFEIGLGGNVGYLEVDHRSGFRYRILPEEQQLSLQYEQLHTVGYKFTDLHLHNIQIDTIAGHISADIKYQSLFEEDILHGIGSSRDALLATDATRVFGQLMQALYYQTEGTDRHKCPNIWLRTMELRSKRPLFSGTCSATVQFDQSRILQQGDMQWKVIRLSGKVGNFEGKFEVAHQISTI